MYPSVPPKVAQFVPDEEVLEHVLGVEARLGELRLVLGLKVEKVDPRIAEVATPVGELEGRGQTDPDVYLRAGQRVAESQVEVTGVRLVRASRQDQVHEFSAHVTGDDIAVLVNPGVGPAAPAPKYL